ncbi:MAG: hypothetical protein OXF79_24585 [Chloroflexi bacterium]|nr:hypothetical protein [Chloroflexota bacterium]
MINVTFDTNCIIALEANEATADDLRRVMRSAAERKLRLRVVAISASERPRRGTTSSGFSGFERKLADAGLGDAEILAGPAIWALSYWDHFLWMGEVDSAKLRQIHGILFPNHPYQSSGEPSGKWRNRLVDTCALWTHLHHGGGAFVTTDDDFHGKRASIQKELGTSILTPHEAAALVAEASR